MNLIPNDPHQNLRFYGRGAVLEALILLTVFSHSTAPDVVRFKTSALIDLADADDVHAERELGDDTDTTVVRVELHEGVAIGGLGRTDPYEWILSYEL